MTAEEMFKELNGLINKDYELAYVFYNELEPELESYFLFFDLQRKLYWFEYCYGGYPDITPKLHKAITKQMEELGWL
jgi:hypothetical protein